MAAVAPSNCATERNREVWRLRVFDQPVFERLNPKVDLPGVIEASEGNPDRLLRFRLQERSHSCPSVTHKRAGLRGPTSSKRLMVSWANPSFALKTQAYSVYS
jgi:hypothetical protein